MRLTVYRMWRDVEKDPRPTNFSNMARRTPPTPPNSNYNNFGGVRHGFATRSNLDRLYGGMGQPYRLPPINSLGSGSNGRLRSLSPMTGAETSCSTAPNVHLGARDSTIEDTEMRTPGPSRRLSQHYDMQPSAAPNSNSQPCVCSCSRDETMVESPLPIQLASAAFNVTRPCSRLPINDLLNRSPHSPTWRGIQNELQQSVVQPLAVNNGSSNNSDHQMTISASSSTRSVSSIGSNSTLQPPFNIAEERCFLLNTLYHICMGATASYIGTLLPASRHRHNQLPHHRHTQARYHPYSPLRSGKPGSLEQNLLFLPVPQAVI